jgi:nucleotide-binding universal stress UspA family protein
MTSRLAERPPVGAPAVDGDDARWSRANVVVLLERPEPSPWALRHLAWFARRMGAKLLVAAVVTHGRELDELDRVNLEAAENGVRDVTGWLVEQGVAADGHVALAQYGQRAVAASDLADRADADVVIVLARRASWFGVLPGSPLAHQLMRRTRRPVLVIPDRSYQESWRRFLLGLVGMDAPRG